MMGGLAIQNIINPMFYDGGGYPYPSPASEIKLIALIIVLMRSGLSIKFDELKATAIVSGVFSWLPYFAEFFLWMYIGVYFFHWRTIDMGLMASIMSPLGPSVVLSGLLQMVAGKKNYGYVPKQMIITTPIEAVIAIVLFGIFSNLEQASGNPLTPWVKVMPLWESCVLIPVNLIFSIVMGMVVGWVCSKYINWRAKIKTDYIWVRVSKNPQMGEFIALYLHYFVCEFL
jgi:Kef-type K+ transport system membrane component KefB